jgi:hypothetical protein
MRQEKKGPQDGQQRSSRQRRVEVTLKMTIGRAVLRRLIHGAWLALATSLVLGCLASSAVASPAWQVVSTSNTTVAPGGQLTYFLDMKNSGTDNTDGSPYTLTATLPDGFKGVSASNFAGFDCGTVTDATVIVCTATDTMIPNNAFQVTITVSVDQGVTGVRTASFELGGGGAPASATTVDPVRISATPPPFGIDAFDGAVEADRKGTPYTQAAGHPYGASTSIDLNTAPSSSPFVGLLQPVEPVKDIVVDLPPGFVGNVTGVATCTNADLANTVGPEGRPLCAPASQIGTVIIVQNGLGLLPNTSASLPVFNLEAPPDVPARFGFNVAGAVIVFDASVRTDSDYGIQVNARNSSEGVSLIGAHLHLWGVPSDPSHDDERACAGQTAPGQAGAPTCTSGAPRKAFLRNPTSCTPPGVGLPTTLHTDSWFHPGDFKEATFFSHFLSGYPAAPQDWGPQQGPDHCDRVPFDPVLKGQPVEGSTAGAPATFTFDLAVPQSDDPDVIGQSDLKKAVVTLPEGVRVSPAAASGLEACASTQIALRSGDDPTCPAASKIGTVSIDTPLLDEPVTGGIYLAKPFDNPFNSLLAVYLVARARGVVIKLSGHVTTDPVTGQITTTFDDNPQLPFSSIHLEFKSGSRSPLAVPNRCGTYTTHAVLTGWNGRVVEQDSSFTLSENAKGRPCPPEFSPSFSAGTSSNSAGSASSFLMRFSRQDEDQQLSSLTVDLPSGLTGRIADVDLCGDVEAKSNACPAGSRIGDVTVGAGAGSSPFFIQDGKAFLTGPYRGAPFGVAIVVPAVAGPFDLGLVTVRSALFVDKHDATVRIVSDPFPTILQGIPLDVRDVRVDVNKPGFFLNPTSCAEKRIAGTLTSTEGTRANVSERFQAAECASLGFRPRMVMRVGGRGHTRAGQTSPFTTTLRMPQRNQANLRFVRVTLPRTINARLNTINDACSRAEFESDIGRCAHAKAGSAVASTPLLRGPLRGSVFFVKNGHAIPDLFVALRGQVDFDLIGRISVVHNALLRTTFATAPDVPIRSFTLRLLGGPSTASIGAVRDLCSSASRAQKAQVDYIGQNGKVRQVDQALKVGGCGRGSHRRHRRG